MPGDVGRADVRVDEHLRRRRRRRGWTIDLLRRPRAQVRRRERLPVALKILPVEGHALEALLVALLEIATAVDGLAWATSAIAVRATHLPSGLGMPGRIPPRRRAAAPASTSATPARWLSLLNGGALGLAGLIVHCNRSATYSRRLSGVQRGPAMSRP